MSAATLEIKTKEGSVFMENFGDLCSYQDLQNRIEDCSSRIRECKMTLTNLALATPKDVFPTTDEDRRAPFDQVSSVFNEVWEELEDAYYEMARLRAVGNILDDWEYIYNVDPKKHWREIVPDPYAELKEDFKETIRESFVDGKKILGEE